MELLNDLITKNNKAEIIKEKYKDTYNENINAIQAKEHNSEYDCRNAQRVD